MGGKAVLDSGMEVLDSGLLDCGIWNSGSQLFVGLSGFLELNSGCQSPGVQFPQPIILISWIPESELLCSCAAVHFNNQVFLSLTPLSNSIVVQSE